jgi:hypothetical protein
MNEMGPKAAKEKCGKCYIYCKGDDARRKSWDKDMTTGTLRPGMGIVSWTLHAVQRRELRVTVPRMAGATWLDSE